MGIQIHIVSIIVGIHNNILWVFTIHDVGIQIHIVGIYKHIMFVFKIHIVGIYKYMMSYSKVV